MIFKSSPVIDALNIIATNDVSSYLLRCVEINLTDSEALGSGSVILIIRYAQRA